MRIATLLGAAVLGLSGIATISIAAPQHKHHKATSGQTNDDGWAQNNSAMPDNAMTPDNGMAPDSSTTTTPDTTTTPPTTPPDTTTPPDATGTTDDMSGGTTTGTTGG
jgi:hypothetical protein